MPKAVAATWFQTTRKAVAASTGASTSSSAVKGSNGHDPLRYQTECLTVIPQFYLQTTR
jgi:hypothetical protein